MAAYTIPSIFTAIDKFTAPVRKMGASVQSFANKAEAGIARADRTLRRLTPTLGQVSKDFLSFASTAALSAAIIGGASFSIKAIKDYEDAIASAKAITGQMTDEAFKPYKEQIESVAAITKKSTIDIAKGFEIVGSAKPELLANAAALAETTKAAITLSKASGDDLQTSALSLTGVMNQFSLGADQAARTMNVLAAGSVAGSANITNVAESMKNFGSVAAGANLSVEESVALVEVLGKFSVFGAEAGTKLRGSILKLQQANLGYASGQFSTNDALLEARKKMDALGSAAQKDQFLIKTFGAENVSTGKILLSNIDLFKEYTKAVTGTNTAVEQAEVKSATFSNRLSELTNKWVNIITSSSEASSSLNFATNAVVFLTDNLGDIIKYVSYFVGGLIALKGVLILSKVALAAYNIVLGVTGALSGTASIAIGANTIALKAYQIATKVATAANWLFNASNPLGWLLIIGSVIALVVSYWDSWGSSVTALATIAAAFFSPVIAALGVIVALVMSVYNNWQMLTDAFTNGGFLDGLLAIGKVLLDVILYPVQQLLGLLSKIPGLDFAEGLQDQLNSFRADLGLVNPEASRQEALSETIKKEQTNATLTIDNKSGFGANLSSDDNFIPVNVSPSYGF